LPGGLADIEMPLLINVFPVDCCIHHKASVFQLKKYAVISGAKAVFVLGAFELFNVAR
jgi:hypothetical protein